MHVMQAKLGKLPYVRWLTLTSGSTRDTNSGLLGEVPVFDQ